MDFIFVAKSNFVVELPVFVNDFVFKALGSVDVYVLRVVPLGVKGVHENMCFEFVVANANHCVWVGFSDAIPLFSICFAVANFCVDNGDFVVTWPQKVTQRFFLWSDQ